MPMTIALSGGTITPRLFAPRAPEPCQLRPNEAIIDYAETRLAMGAEHGGACLACGRRFRLVPLDADGLLCDCGASAVVGLERIMEIGL